MQQDSIWLDIAREQPLFVRTWLPEGKPRALLMIVHGMGEHSARYARFAEALCAVGIGVFAHDQRGHGQTGSRAVLGHYGDQGGWERVIADVAALQAEIQRRFCDTPLFLFGHSMGSYISQGFLIRHGEGLQGAILSGSNYQPAWLYRLARGVVGIERLRQGPRGRSAFFNHLTFGKFNLAITPRRTDFDWLSRDPAEVDRYIADPLCGFLCTNQLWLDLLHGLTEISNRANLSRIDPELPVLVVGGSHDPVSEGKRLRDLEEALVVSGHRQTRLRVYTEGRHEMLNETNRDEVTAYLIEWLEAGIARASHSGSELDNVA